MVSVDEGDGTVQVCAVLSYFLGATRREFSLTLVYNDDSGNNYIYIIIAIIFNLLSFAALAGTDYTGISTTLTFTNNSMDGDVECVSIAIIDDDALELDETFTMTLTTSEPRVTFTNNDVTVITITDDDG